MHPGFVIEWEGLDDSGKSRCIPTWELPEPDYVAIDSVAQTIKTHTLGRHEFMIWPPYPPLCVVASATPRERARLLPVGLRAGVCLPLLLTSPRFETSRAQTTVFSTNGARL